MSVGACRLSAPHSLSDLFIVGFLQAFLQLRRELVIAVLTYWFLVKFEKLGLLTHFAVTDGAGKMVHTPGLVEGTEHISINNVVADKADVAE